MQMIKTIKYIATVIVAGMMLCGCDSTPSSSKILPDFVKKVNAESKKTGVTAIMSDEMLVLNLKLEKTPENYGKALMMRASQDAKDCFVESLTGRLCEGPVLEQIVNKKLNLAFAITVDDMELNAVFTPDDIKKFIKENTK